MANDREQFDVGSFLSQFDSEFVEDAEPAGEPEGEPEKTAVPEKQDIQETEVEQTDVEPEVEEPEVEAEPSSVEPSVETVNDPDLHKRNEAFKKLREEKEKLEQSDKFLADLATQYGMTKDELMKKFKEERDAKAAQAQGIPVEQYKKVQQLEQEVSTIKQRYAQEAFNYEAERLVQRYNIPADQIQTVFAKIGALGLDVLGNPKLLDVAYKALNYDVALQKGRQAQLQETKKRRETTASPTLGTKGTNVDTSDTDMDAEIDAFLKQKIGK